MNQTVQVLVLIDNDNKIYYTEDKSFAANDIEAINQAMSEYFALVLQAELNGYQIVKREKNVTPMDDGIMVEIDEKINKFGGR